MDLLDSGRTNGPNLVSLPFRSDGAPDFQAQYEAHVRSIMGPIQGEFQLNCSPAFPDDDAAGKHSFEWRMWMREITAGIFEAKDVVWAPVYAANNATDANASAGEPAQRTSASAAQKTRSGSASQAASPVAQNATQETAASQTAVDAEAQRQAEQRRQHWERQRLGASGDAGADAGAGAKPLRFVLWIGLRPQLGDTHNPTCYSNVITRPGPPGWGAPGFQASVADDRNQALQTVMGLKAAFIAQCRSSGRETLSEGNFAYSWNQTERDEAELGGIGARFPEDITVQMN